MRALFQNASGFFSSTGVWKVDLRFSTSLRPCGILDRWIPIFLSYVKSVTIPSGGQSRPYLYPAGAAENWWVQKISRLVRFLTKIHCHFHEATIRFTGSPQVHRSWFSDNNLTHSFWWAKLEWLYQTSITITHYESFFTTHLPIFLNEIPTLWVPTPKDMVILRGNVRLPSRIYSPNLILLNFIQIQLGNSRGSSPCAPEGILRGTSGQLELPSL